MPYDTLIYAYKGRVRAKTPISSYLVSGIIRKIDLSSIDADSADSANGFTLDSLHRISKIKGIDSLTEIFILNNPKSFAYISGLNSVDSALVAGSVLAGNEKSANPSAISLRLKKGYVAYQVNYSSILNVDLLFYGDSIGSPKSFSQYSEYEHLKNITGVVSSSYSFSELKTRKSIAYAYSLGSEANKVQTVNAKTFIAKLSNGRFAVFSLSGLNGTECTVNILY